MFGIKFLHCWVKRLMFNENILVTLFESNKMVRGEAPDPNLLYRQGYIVGHFHNPWRNLGIQELPSVLTRESDLVQVGVKY